MRIGRRAYDLLYRVGPPWGNQRSPELVELVTSGRIAPGRAIDLGCGSGQNALFLAARGFEVTGVDFSPVAVAAARAAAESDGLVAEFVRGDLTEPPAEWSSGTYDLVVDHSVLDDLQGADRARMAAGVHELTHPGSTVVIWCFYDEIAWWRRAGARYPGIRPGELEERFGAAFSVDRLPEPAAGSGFGCFLLTRR